MFSELGFCNALLAVRAHREADVVTPKVCELIVVVITTGAFFPRPCLARCVRGLVGLGADETVIQKLPEDHQDGNVKVVSELTCGLNIRDATSHERAEGLVGHKQSVRKAIAKRFYALSVLGRGNGLIDAA